MRNIGGYFDLHIESHYEILHKGIYLNSGRSCFEYICTIKNIKRVWLPSYICYSLIPVIEKLNIEVVYYNIDRQLRPILNFDQIHSDDEIILIINYFGINDYLLEEYKQYNSKIVWDLTQAFYCEMHNEGLAFYSPRKFFGVPDGGILVGLIENHKQLPLRSSISSDKCMHLLLRLEAGPLEGFKTYQMNEKRIENEGMRRMSNLTFKLLKTIDYESAKRKRINNFKFLHSKFRTLNGLELRPNCYPMFYPLSLTTKTSIKLRNILRSNQIFVPKFWDSLEKWLPQGSIGIELSDKLLPIPIDHRYDESDMDMVVNLIMRYIDN